MADQESSEPTTEELLDAACQLIAITSGVYQRNFEKFWFGGSHSTEHTAKHLSTFQGRTRDTVRRFAEFSGSCPRYLDADRVEALLERLRLLCESEGNGGE